MGRPDISLNLVHFTSGSTWEEAFKRLQKIIRERRILGSIGKRKGGYRCVSFSEAPLVSIEEGLKNLDDYSRYSPFGIMVTKQWLFTKGGRPVIYQPDSEYRALPETHRWRHVLYEIRDGFQFSDFTWEREWRIPCEHLEFDHTTAQLVVPDSSWASRLVREHEDDQDYTVRHYSLIMEASLAQYYWDPFQWTVNTLK